MVSDGNQSLHKIYVLKVLPSNYEVSSLVCEYCEYWMDWRDKTNQQPELVFENPGPPVAGPNLVLGKNLLGKYSIRFSTWRQLVGVVSYLWQVFHFFANLWPISRKNLQVDI